MYINVVCPWICRLVVYGSSIFHSIKCPFITYHAFCANIEVFQQKNRILCFHIDEIWQMIRFNAKRLLKISIICAVSECVCVSCFLFIPIGRKLNPTIIQLLKKRYNVRWTYNLLILMCSCGHAHTYCMYLKLVEMSFSGKAEEWCEPKRNIVYGGKMT